MNNNRFPGYVKSKADCEPKQPSCKKILLCPPRPVVHIDRCKDRVIDRGVIIKRDTYTVTDKCGNCKNVNFIIESFSGNILIPTNLDTFCAFDLFSDNDIIAVHAEVDPEYCTDINALPVKLITLKKVARLYIKNVTGKIEKAIDKNNNEYYRIHEVFDQSTRYNNGKPDPLYHLVANKLNMGFVDIYYAISNVVMKLTGVQTPSEYLETHIGKNVTVVYIDYGKETLHKIGIPIVITDLIINE